MHFVIHQRAFYVIKIRACCLLDGVGGTGGTCGTYVERGCLDTKHQSSKAKSFHQRSDNTSWLYFSEEVLRLLPEAVHLFFFQNTVVSISFLRVLLWNSNPQILLGFTFSGRSHLAAPGLERLCCGCPLHLCYQLSLSRPQS